MPSEVHLSEMITIGNPITLECPSPKTSFGVVFEDDGETGYLYGLNFENEEQPILDALHIYNVKDIVDKDVSVKVEIIWSEDGLKACLQINGFPHAVFDFESSKAYCRTNFPRPDRRFTNSHKWNDEALELFK
ncbi:MAG TPA: DUF2251 domain-containing protein [Anaerolineales bacterium]|nr:DUF2251 domain-containing protein [Anaerolineales bacterium]